MSEQSDRLRLARQRKGLSGPKEAAARFHWQYNAYKHHENGTRGFKPKTAAKYAKAYNVKAEWLLCIETNGPGLLTAEESWILETFRRMSADGRAAVVALCAHYGKSDQPNRRAS